MTRNVAHSALRGESRLNALAVKRAAASSQFQVALVAVLAAICLLWSYWPTLTELAEFWSANEDYSAGQLAPFVACYLAWRTRREAFWRDARPHWWGAAALALSQAVRFAGIYYGYASLERFSMVLTIGALLLLLAGWSVFRKLIWVQIFLLMMAPFPQRIHNAIAPPLQSGATTLGKAGLELLGFYVAREGNVLRVDEQSSVMVAEACSGLRMLTAFVFTAAFLCFLIRRPAWQKIALVLSSIPVAVITNGLRVIATSIVVRYSDSATFEKQFHDFAGLAMMPVAVLLLLAELRFMALFPAERPRRKPSAERSPSDPAERSRIQARSPGRRRMQTIGAVASVALLSAGWGQRALIARIDGALDRVLPLGRSLAGIPMELGAWHGREAPLDRAALGNVSFDDEFVNRAYTDMDRGTSILAFIGYVGRPRTHFGHRPDICFAAHGFRQVEQETATLTVADGRSIRCALHTFERPDRIGPPVLVLASYMINGDYWSSPDDLNAWSARNPGLFGERPAYLTRIHLSLAGGADRASDRAALEDLMRELAGPTAECMPYWGTATETPD